MKSKSSGEDVKLGLMMERSRVRVPVRTAEICHSFIIIISKFCCIIWLCCNCMKDRLPERHSCLNLYLCVIRFSQSVSHSLRSGGGLTVWSFGSNGKLRSCLNRFAHVKDSTAQENRLVVLATLCRYFANVRCCCRHQTGVWLQELTALGK